MSSNATIDQSSVTLKEWLEFCQEYKLKLSDTPGQWVHVSEFSNTRVEVSYSNSYSSTDITIRSVFRTTCVALLAKQIWIRWGGKLEADREIRAWFGV